MTVDLRVIDSSIGKVTPVIDIADSIGYDRSSITKIIKSNGDIFGGTEVFCPLPTPGGSQNFRCINRIGLDRLMVLLKPARSRDSFEKFMEFKERALDRLNGDRLSIAVAPTETNNNHSIKDEIDRAKELANLTGGDINAFLKIALENCGYGKYAPALDQQSIIHGNAGQWYNPTQLVAMVHDPYLNPERLNWYLCNNPKDPDRRPFQYRDENKIWRLTPLGMEHGREYIYTAPSQHQEIRIAWRESVLYASGLLKRPQTTMALSVRA